MVNRSPVVLKDGPARYCIGISGQLDDSWSDWFDQMVVDVCYEQGGLVTTLCGQVRDQAALYGLLARVRDLGLILLYVERLDGAPETPKTSDSGAERPQSS